MVAKTSCWAIKPILVDGNMSNSSFLVGYNLPFLEGPMCTSGYGKKMSSWLVQNDPTIIILIMVYNPNITGVIPYTNYMVAGFWPLRKNDVAIVLVMVDGVRSFRSLNFGALFQGAIFLRSFWIHLGICFVTKQKSLTLPLWIRKLVSNENHTFHSWYLQSSLTYFCSWCLVGAKKNDGFHMTEALGYPMTPTSQAAIWPAKVPHS